MKPTNARPLVFLFALAATAAVAPPARAAFNAYLKIEGVEGESKDSKHPGWIEVESYQFDAIHNSTVGRTLDRAGAGRVTLSEITITKQADTASSAKLAEAAAKGTHFSQATIELRKAGETQQAFLVIKMEQVFISSFRTSGHQGNLPVTETITLAAGKIEWVYTPVATPPARRVAVAAGAASLAVANVPRTITKVTPSAASAATGYVLTFQVEGTGACERSRIDFGDGTSAEFPFSSGKAVPAPTHAYARAGTFEVKAYGLADPWARLTAQPSTGNVCGGHASATVKINAAIGLVPAIR